MEDLTASVGIRMTAPGCYALTWSPDFSGSPVTVFAGPAPDAIRMDHAVCRDATSGYEIDGFEPGQRQYFCLRAQDRDDLIVAQRNVPLDGAVNFRDLGGYATGDGRRVRWGRLYRSGHLSTLSATGRGDFTRLDISTVCDFRLAEERAKENMVLPEGMVLEAIEIPPGVRDPQYFHRVFRESSDPEDVADAVHEVVRSMVNESADRYRRLFEVLLAAGDRCILINCSAGKERTGVASALILSALGVPRETIYYDFMLSGIYFPAFAEIPRVLEKYAVGAVGEEAERLVMPLLETRRSYLEVAFDSIDRECGSADAFLRKHYDLGDAELKALRTQFTA